MKTVRPVVFLDLGHLPQEEAPARSLPPVRAFLRGAEPAAGTITKP